LLAFHDFQFPPPEEIASKSGVDLRRVLRLDLPDGEFEKVRLSAAPLGVFAVILVIMEKAGDLCLQARGIVGFASSSKPKNGTLNVGR